MERDAVQRTGALPGEETLIASWRALAEMSPGARVVTTRVAVAAVFPNWAVLNNAIALDGRDESHIEGLASELSELYATAGVSTWALWVPSEIADLDAPDSFATLGTLKRDNTTLVMRADLRDGFRSNPAVVHVAVNAASLVGDEPVAATELPEPVSRGAIEGWALVNDGTAIAGAWSCIHGGDCGIYAVGTVPGWRRRGFGRAIVEHILADARGRGAETTTLQSTPMGQRLYASLGYVPAGRYEEWVSQ